MKTTHHSLDSLVRQAGAGALLCSCWLAPGALAAESAAPATSRAGTSQDAAPEKDETEYRNWVEIGFGGALRSSGDDAAFQRRIQRPSGAFGGIESLHYEEDIGKTGLFKVDSRGIFDAKDYGLAFELSDPSQGFLRGSYQQFRTWYDGSGGFFPGNNQWFSLYDEGLELDRSDLLLEGGLTLPDAPQITFSYRRQARDGLKDSTIWGDTNLTGGAGTRAIVPSFLRLNEVRDTFAGDVRHTLGNTTLGVGVRYEIYNQDNSRNMRRRPGERVTDALGPRRAERYVTHRDGMDGDLFSVHTSGETRISDDLMFTVGYAFTSFETQLSGSRIYGESYEAVYDPMVGNRQQRDEGFYHLNGGSDMSQHLGNVNLMWTPLRTLTAVASFRVEKQSLDGASDFLETAVGGSPKFVTAEEEVAVASQRGILDLSQSLELRYTGVTNMVLYARGFWLQGEGDLTETERVGVPGVVDLLRDTDFTRSAQKYTAGINWYPHRKVTAGAQYYHKMRGERYTHLEDNTPNRAGNRYPAFIRAQDFDTDDANFRVTVRPLANLTLVSRYDLQFSTIRMQGDELARINSAELTTHIFSQSVSWIPWSRLGLQAAVNYVMDETDTPALEALGKPVVQDNRNNYWFVNSTATFAVDDKTDLQLYYQYYLADNYRNNAAFSQPYLAGAEEHTLGATATRRLSQRLKVALRYGFFTYHDQTSGGFNDFDGHLVYSTVQYLF